MFWLWYLLNNNNLFFIGVYTRNNGDKYNGDLTRDGMNGNGVYTNSDGSKYTGQWVDRKEEGYGVKEWLITQ